MDKFMRRIAEFIDQKIYDHYGNKGFALIVFEFNQPALSNYVSNADRKDMIKALRETADRLERNEDIPPTIGSIQ